MTQPLAPQVERFALGRADCITILESLEEISELSALNARQIKLRAQIKIHLANLESQQFALSTK